MPNSVSTPSRMCPLLWTREACARCACAAPERQRRTPATIVAMSVFMFPPCALRTGARGFRSPPLRSDDRRGSASDECDRVDDTGPMVAGKEPAIGEDEQGCELRVTVRTYPEMHNYRGTPGHSARSAIIGSMREARQAGSQLAACGSGRRRADRASPSC